MRSFLLVSALVGCRPDLIVGTTSPPPGDTDPRQDGPDGGDSHDGGAEDGGSDDGGSAGGDDGSDGTDGGAGDGGDTGEPDPADRDGWVLVWRDEFDATELDRSLWDVEVNAWGGGNNELQYYTDRPENIRLEDGALIIEAHEESYTGAEGTRSYTSGRVRTRGNGDWTHGRFEARLKVPTGQGMWSAFWMLPTDDAYGGWAASGEIDVMELLGHQPDTVYGTLHYGGSWPNNTHTGAPFTSPSPYSDDFHEFAVEWTEDAFHWFVDGVLVQTQTTWYSDGGAFPAPFDQRFHILLNLAVGGDWPGSPDATTTFPQQLVVDHVRVYKPDDEDPHARDHHADRGHVVHHRGAPTRSHRCADGARVRVMGSGRRSGRHGQRRRLLASHHPHPIDLDGVPVDCQRRLRATGRQHASRGRVRTGHRLQRLRQPRVVSGRRRCVDGVRELHPLPLTPRGGSQAEPGLVSTPRERWEH